MHGYPKTHCNHYGWKRTLGEKEIAASCSWSSTRGSNRQRDCQVLWKNWGEYLTLFAFSSENANRSKEEVSSLSKLFLWTLQNEEKKLMKHNVSLEIVGDLSIFSDEIQNKAQKVTQNLSQNTGLKLIIAANYGGRWELFDAAKKFATDCIKNNLTPELTQESEFSEKLATANHPEVDLLIRTSGEQRLSNFLLWSIAYAEFFFSDVLWPDFKPEDIDKAIEAFNHRERRYGKRELSA